jgi:hypothetical protein
MLTKQPIQNENAAFRFPVIPNYAINGRANVNIPSGGPKKSEYGLSPRKWKLLGIETACLPEKKAIHRGRSFALTHVKQADGYRVATDGFRMYVESGDYKDEPLPDGLTFPDWKVIMPKTSKLDIVCDVYQLWLAVRCAAIMSTTLAMDVFDGMIKFTSKTYEIGTVETEYKVESFVGVIRTAVNAIYMLDALQWLGKGECVLSFTVDNAPMLLSTESIRMDGNKSAIIMPMNRRNI